MRGWEETEAPHGDAGLIDRGARRSSVTPHSAFLIPHFPPTALPYRWGMPFEVEIRRTFSAAHALRLPGGVVEPLHGHDFAVVCCFARDDGGLDQADCVVDFHQLETALDATIGPWNSRNLNETEPFDRAVNPSAERIAEQIAKRVSERIIENPHVPPSVRLRWVSISEAPGCVARWTAGAGPRAAGGDQ